MNDSVSINISDWTRQWSSNLPTVEILPRQPVEVFGIIFCRSVGCCGLFQKACPDLLSCGETQRFVPHRQSDPALDCVIEVPDSVGREKHDPLIVLELAEEDRDASVLMTVDRARLHEHIRFIQKDQGFPVIRQLRDMGQLILQLLRFMTQLSGRNLDGQNAQQH